MVVPAVLRGQLLNELHWEHPGICSMKAIAISFMWWPGLDGEIELVVKSCTVCQNVRSLPPKVPLHPWKWSSRPFQRVHIDFCQNGKDYFLVLIDSHSKWIDVKHMTSTATEGTIDELEPIFAKHGLPEQLVSDNGPRFTSEQFARFTRQNGIKHISVPPYHPALNGAAERSVRAVKEALEKQVLQGTGSMTMKHRLANFLIKYRSTPHSVTGRTPAELMVKRQLRTKLTLLKPNLVQAVENKQMKQKLYHDKSQVERGFTVNEPVRVRITDRGFASQSRSGVQVLFWRSVEIGGISSRWVL